MSEELDNECEVVNSIYENCMEPWAEGIYSVRIPNTLVTVRMRFPEDYPESAPFVLDIQGVKSNKADVVKEKLQNSVSETFTTGEVYVYTFVDEAGHLLESLDLDEEPEMACTDSAEPEFLHEWTVSEEIKDRKSVFVGRALAVTSEEEALLKIADLVKEKRIARATHNIQAWRIKSANGELAQGNDSDYESGAGSRLLHLLNVSDATNVVVVVSRWYGGIHLGPDRFKHINACAVDALRRGRFI